MEIRQAVGMLVTNFDMELKNENLAWEYSGIDTFTLALPPLFISSRTRQHRNSRTLFSNWRDGLFWSEEQNRPRKSYQ